MSDNSPTDLNVKPKNRSVKIINDRVVGDGNKRMKMAVDDIGNRDKRKRHCKQLVTLHHQKDPVENSRYSALQIPRDVTKVDMAERGQNSPGNGMFPKDDFEDTLSKQSHSQWKDQVDENEDPQRDKEWENGLVDDIVRITDYNKKKCFWKGTYFGPYEEKQCEEDILSIYDRLFKLLVSLTNSIFVVLGIEKCPFTGRHHCHILVEFSEGKRYQTIKNVIPNARWRFLDGEKAVRDWYQYVVKTRTKIPHSRSVMTWEKMEGELEQRISETNGMHPVTKQLHDNLEAILKNDWDDIDPWFLFNNAARIMRFSRLVPRKTEVANHDKLIFIHGPTGTGKTSLFRRWIDPQYIYTKSATTQWFDGYMRQPIILIDNVDPESFQKRMMDWNRFGDRNYTTVKIKHGTVNLHNDWFVVISNYSLHDLCTKTLPSGKKRFDSVLYSTFQRYCGNPEDGYRIMEIKEGTYDYNSKRDAARVIRELCGQYADEILTYFIFCVCCK